MEPNSPPWKWVWTGNSHINARGIVISTATVQLVQHEVRALTADPLQEERALALKHGLEVVLAIFRDKKCVLPIRDDIAAFADQHLTQVISYLRPAGGIAQIGILEKIVIATAIRGFNDQPIWLIDYDQPYAFPKLDSQFGLAHKTFPRPGAEISRALV